MNRWMLVVLCGCADKHVVSISPIAGVGILGQNSKQYVFHHVKYAHSLFW